MEGSPETLADELSYASNVSWRASAWPVLHEGSPEELADELVLAMLADELALAMTSWSRIPNFFQERIMGAGTALGLYNVSLQ